MSFGYTWQWGSPAYQFERQRQNQMRDQEALDYRRLCNNTTITPQEPKPGKTWDELTPEEKAWEYFLIGVAGISSLGILGTVAIVLL